MYTARLHVFFFDEMSEHNIVSCMQSVHDSQPYHDVVAEFLGICLFFQPQVDWHSTKESTSQKRLLRQVICSNFISFIIYRYYIQLDNTQIILWSTMNMWNENMKYYAWAGMHVSCVWGRMCGGACVCGVRVNGYRKIAQLFSRELKLGTYSVNSSDADKEMSK